ncbi:MAG TPA: hypothetical protein VEU47_14350 [Candidatus Cybelea sp.]|nr:hypothetical protein [Candidatus Cybelea sp.]
MTFDPDDAPDLDELPALQAVVRFARMVRNVAWFSSLGEPLSDAERADAGAYVSALGFPGVDIAGVANWDEAEAAIRNPGWNTEWWEAEEQLRAALITEAAEQFGERTLMMVLTAVTSAVSDVVHGAAAVAAARGGVADQGLIRAAAGAATQCAYQAALVLAAGQDDEHPFALKYRLFEGGRWPLGIVGATFNLF